MEITPALLAHIRKWQPTKGCANEDEMIAAGLNRYRRLEHEYRNWQHAWSVLMAAQAEAQAQLQGKLADLRKGCDQPVRKVYDGSGYCRDYEECLVCGAPTE